MPDTSPTPVEPAVVLYEALHDATCSEHGAHCEEFRAQVTDACRVALWRLEEAGYTVVAATTEGQVNSADDDVMIGLPDPAAGVWTVRPLQIYAHELWCEIRALRSRTSIGPDSERIRELEAEPKIYAGTPAHVLIEAVRTSFYRCDLLPPAIFEAVKAYEAAGQPCSCSCHEGDDHCDQCCTDRLCDDCRAYAGSDR